MPKLNEGAAGDLLAISRYDFVDKQLVIWVKLTSESIFEMSNF